MQASEICAVFHDCFQQTHQARLVGDADEPFYQPAANDGESNTIFFREDFASSALHEIAHWCIAGSGRRKLPDFGYWYEADRGALKQREFESLEARPQGLEWILSQASDTPFRVSCDNFDETTLDRQMFRHAVRAEAQAWLSRGLTARTQRLVEALMARSGNGDAMNIHNYEVLPS